jgi:CheY-like chemotaxis protein
VLEEHRATVTGVASVAEALTFLDRATADVLVSDIAMPGEDGYCLIRKVWERAPGAGGRIPALALTAYVGEEDGERALAAGFNQHAGKPVQVLELVAQIAQLAGRTPAPPAPPTRAKR